MSNVGRSTRQPTNREQIDLAALCTFLATQPDVAAAYLFGSWAEGRPNARSDVDMAILLSGEPDAIDAGKRQLALMGGMESLLAPRTLDVIVLNAAPPLLVHQVLRHGKLVYEHDLEARVEFEVHAGKVYADLAPMYESHNRDLLQKIKEVGLGERRRRHPQSPAVTR